MSGRGARHIVQIALEFLPHDKMITNKNLNSFMLYMVDK